jgi:hypothetical protein
MIYLYIFFMTLYMFNLGNASTVEYIEDSNTIKLIKKYPGKLFSGLGFMQEMKSFIKSKDLSSISQLNIDISNDSSVTSRDVELILHEMNFFNLPNIFLNLSNTSVKSDVLGRLTESNYIKGINIVGSEAAEDDWIEKNLALAGKKNIIFISQEDLDSMEEDDMDEVIMENHYGYYGVSPKRAFHPKYQQPHPQRKAIFGQRRGNYGSLGDQTPQYKHSRYGGKIPQSKYNHYTDYRR